MHQWQDVLEYWFGPDQTPGKEYRQRWFSGGAETDREIQQRFGELHAYLTQAFPAEWPVHGDSLLAGILVLDQFSRNLYRGKPAAFAWDDRAVEWSLQGWEQDLFTPLAPARQAFSIMPLMHSESLTLHDQAIARLVNLQQQQQQSDTIITGFLSSAHEHRDIIARYGRYPHRNTVLGRSSSQDEKRFLADGAKRFGQ